MLKFDWNILWTLINLVFFFLLMKFTLFKPIKKVLDKRQELIDKEIEDARHTSELADEKLADYENKIADVQAEGEKIIADAKDDAKVEYNKIVARAQQDADDIKEQTRKQMAMEQENARRASKEELAALAMQAAEKVIGKSASAQTDSDIFDEFLNESSVD